VITLTQIIVLRTQPINAFNQGFIIQTPYIGRTAGIGRLCAGGHFPNM